MIYAVVMFNIIFSEKEKFLNLLILCELLHIIRVTKETYDFSDS